jgi:membrane associated rhomboid family serine protease
VKKTHLTEEALSSPAHASQQKHVAYASYQAALSKYRTLPTLTRISWATWIIVIGTTLLWCFTAYQAALAGGAHTLQGIIANISSNAINIQDKDNNALTTVLITYGAKDNTSILHGEYWRFVTPMFLHANALHLGMNMINLLALGVALERLFGHLRFLLIFLVTGVISAIASFYFAPQEISVGASGAIFGLVGAYSAFILVHRKALRYGGIPALLWLIVIIGLNLSIGFFIQNVDNYAHVGGLLSGLLLGWGFTPLYRPQTTNTYTFTDVNSLSHRWPLALLTILGTLALAITCLYLQGVR